MQSTASSHAEGYGLLRITACRRCTYVQVYIKLAFCARPDTTRWLAVEVSRRQQRVFTPLEFYPIPSRGLATQAS